MGVGQPAHAISSISTDDGQHYSPESYQKALNNTPLSVFAQAAAAYASAPPLGNLRTPDILVRVGITLKRVHANVHVQRPVIADSYKHASPCMYNAGLCSL